MGHLTDMSGVLLQTYADELLMLYELNVLVVLLC